MRTKMQTLMDTGENCDHLDAIMDLKPKDKLKPCPWCGQQPRVGSAAGMAFVDCVKCTNIRKFGKTFEQAIAAWNERFVIEEKL